VQEHDASGDGIDATGTYCEPTDGGAPAQRGRL